MAPHTSTRLAWSVAIAALALWATSAPVSWGQVAAGAARLFDDTTDQPGDSIAIDQSSSSVTISSSSSSNSSTTTTTAPDVSADNPTCPPAPPALSVVTPPVTTPPPPPSTVASAQDGTFHLCGGDMQATERAIEQLIAGRGFSSSLSAQGDGCASLTIRPTSQSSTGSATSNLSVGLGSGKNLSIQIVSQGGATRVSIKQEG